MSEAAKAQRPEVLLITENKTLLLEMHRDGKFSAKSSAWEDNKVLLEGEELVIRVDGGRWFIAKRPMQGSIGAARHGGTSDAPDAPDASADEILDAPVAPQPASVASLQGGVALQQGPVAPQQGQPAMPPPAARTGR